MVHGYLGYAPQFLAICVALVAFSLALRVTGRLHGSPRRLAVRARSRRSPS